MAYVCLVVPARAGEVVVKAQMLGLLRCADGRIGPGRRSELVPRRGLHPARDRAAALVTAEAVLKEVGVPLSLLSIKPLPRQGLVSKFG
jgi:hypothetical protein